MKRILVIFCLLLFSPLLIFSGECLPFEGNTYKYSYFSELEVDFQFSFNDGKFKIQYDQDDPTKKMEDSKEAEGHPGYYYVEKNEDYTIVRQRDYVIIRTKSSKYVVYYYKSEFCLLVDIKTGRHFWGRNVAIREVSTGAVLDYFPGFQSPIRTSLKESSFLVEKTKKGEVTYSVRGFAKSRTTMPWVEGVEGYGIGEWIELLVSASTSKFLIFNGFTYLDDLNYYYYNSRVKKLDVVVDGETYSYSLEDTPQIQIIQLPRMIKGENSSFYYSRRV